MKIQLKHIKNATENISRYYEKEVSLCERMSANFDEVAAFVADEISKSAKEKGFFGGDSPLEPYMPYIEEEQMLYGTLPENAGICDVKLSLDRSVHLADFCAKVASKLRQSVRLRPNPALFKESASKVRAGKVAFAESRILSSAFAEFSRSDTGLVASYVRSFNDACEDVASEVCDYCILPIENSREGALLTVYGLIERYDLFISRVCSVESDEITTKFALLCRENHGIIEINNKQHVDIRLSGHDLHLLPRLHAAAATLGAENVKTVSVPLGYTDGYAHIFTFFASGEALFSLLLFLSTIRADYTVIGVYE